jgi:beta-lactamase class A
VGHGAGGAVAARAAPQHAPAAGPLLIWGRQGIAAARAKLGRAEGGIALDATTLAAELDAIAADEGMEAAVAASWPDGSPIVALREDESYYPASTIKVPIMVEVFRQAHVGRFRLSDRLRLGAEDQVTGSGVLQHLSPGIRLPIRDVVTLMIVVSDNTATNMLIDLVGADAVNETMAALGLRHTVLFNKLQVVPVERRGLNVTTAGDMTRLLVKIARGEAVSYDACRRMVEILKRQSEVQRLGGRLPIEPAGEVVGAPPPVVLAAKSGSVSGLCHDVGLILRPSGSYAVSILLRGVDRTAHGVDVIARMSRRLFDAVAER